MKTSKHYTNVNYFNEINANSAYILGFILGDGQIGVNDSNNYFLRINIHPKDIEVLEFIIKEISPTRNISSYQFVQKSGLLTQYKYIKITSNELIKPLIDFGIIPRKTGKERFPQIPKEFISHFLRGYFDADGSLAIKNKTDKKTNQIYTNHCFTYTCANKQFLEDIKDYFGFGQVTDGHGKCYTYTANKMEEIEKIGNIFYQDGGFCLKRKKDRFDNMPKKTKYEAFGELKTLSEWTKDKRCIVHKDTVYYRINNTNMNIEEILTTPPKTKTANMYNRNKIKSRKHNKNHFKKFGEN